MIWTLLLLGTAIGYALRWAQKELNAERFWILPYRGQCRRYIRNHHESNNGLVEFPCSNQVWRIRWNALSPLSVVCSSCRKAEAKGRAGA